MVGFEIETKTNRSEGMVDYELIKNFLVESELPLKQFKNSNNFVIRTKIKFTPTPKKVNDKIPNFDSLFQSKPANPPSILIMKTINKKTLYTVYQNLITRDFSVIAYNLKKIKHWNKANSLIIINYPYLDNDYLLEKYKYYIYYFSNGRTKEIIFLPDEQIKNNKSMKKKF